MAAQVRIDPSRIDAVILDTDGVITDTAAVHRAAWKQLFDDYLRSQLVGGEELEPFTEDDYRRYVDGKPRYDGVRSFLGSRGIELPEGDLDDPPGDGTVQALGNRKNAAFVERLERDGAEAFPGTVRLLRDLRDAGVATAVISASRNCAAVLASAGVSDLFDTRVDGLDQEELGFPGKPDPSVFEIAAERLGVAVDRAVVVEDAIAGVEAGRRGGFALVIGVDRTGHPDDLRANGADVVVEDLDEVEVATTVERTAGRTLQDLPLALDRWDEVAARVGEREPAVFLDYDGTLTPIVDDPDAATLPPATRAAIRRLMAVCTVAVVSGRDLDDVRGMVGVDGMHYAGSHGFDILAPDGERLQFGREYLAALDAAEEELGPRLRGIEGARLERKLFAIAVHYRQVDDDDVRAVEAAARAVGEDHDDLRVTGGKRIFELRPALDWDKGKALRHLLETLDLDRPDVVPLYLGDDDTDEDGFEAIGGDGVGIVVRGESDRRPTSADFALRDTDEARVVLERLAAHLEGTR